MPQTAIIAVIGLPGSGKTEVIKYLESKGLSKVYFGAIVLDEVKRRGLTLKQEHERPVRDELRRTYGMAAMAKLSLPRIRELAKQENVLIESLYSWEEYLLLKKEFGERFKTIAVYASPATRYKRLENRSERPLTEQEAWERDKSQIEDAHQAGPIAMADYILINEGSIETLHKAIADLYGQLFTIN